MYLLWLPEIGFVYLGKPKIKVMAKLEINIPDDIPITPELVKRIQLASLPEIAEHHALVICEKHFGKKFKLGKYNSVGFDIVSEDESIVVEVKQTSCVMPDGSKRLQIQSFMNKKDIMTHILILDYYSNRGCILEHDDFFYNTHHYPVPKMWRWDSEYNMKGSNRCSENTEWFLNNEVKL